MGLDSVASWSFYKCWVGWTDAHAVIPHENSNRNACRPHIRGVPVLPWNVLLRTALKNIGGMVRSVIVRIIATHVDVEMANHLTPVVVGTHIYTTFFSGISIGYIYPLLKGSNEKVKQLGGCLAHPKGRTTTGGCPRKLGSKVRISGNITQYTPFTTRLYPIY